MRRLLTLVVALAAMAVFPYPARAADRSPEGAVIDVGTIPVTGISRRALNVLACPTKVLPILQQPEGKAEFERTSVLPSGKWMIVPHPNGQGYVAIGPDFVVFFDASRDSDVLRWEGRARARMVSGMTLPSLESRIRLQVNTTPPHLLRLGLGDGFPASAFHLIESIIRRAPTNSELARLTPDYYAQTIFEALEVTSDRIPRIADLDCRSFDANYALNLATYNPARVTDERLMYSMSAVQTLIVAGSLVLSVLIVRLTRRMFRIVILTTALPLCSMFLPVLLGGFTFTWDTDLLVNMFFVYAGFLSDVRIPGWSYFMNSGHPIWIELEALPFSGPLELLWSGLAASASKYWGSVAAYWGFIGLFLSWLAIFGGFSYVLARMLRLSGTVSATVLGILLTSSITVTAFPQAHVSLAPLVFYPAGLCAFLVWLRSPSYRTSLVLGVAIGLNVRGYQTPYSAIAFTFAFASLSVLLWPWAKRAVVRPSSALCLIGPLAYGLPPAITALKWLRDVDVVARSTGLPSSTGLTDLLFGLLPAAISAPGFGYLGERTFFLTASALALVAFGMAASYRRYRAGGTSFTSRARAALVIATMPTLAAAFGAFLLVSGATRNSAFLGVRSWFALNTVLMLYFALFIGIAIQTLALASSKLRRSAVLALVRFFYPRARIDMLRDVFGPPRPLALGPVMSILAVLTLFLAILAACSALSPLRNAVLRDTGGAVLNVIGLVSLPIVLLVMMIPSPNGWTMSKSTVVLCLAASANLMNMGTLYMKRCNEWQFGYCFVRQVPWDWETRYPKVLSSLPSAEQVKVDYFDVVSVAPYHRWGPHIHRVLSDRIDPVLQPLETLKRWTTPGVSMFSTGAYSRTYDLQVKDSGDLKFSFRPVDRKAGIGRPLVYCDGTGGTSCAVSDVRFEGDRVSGRLISSRGAEITLSNYSTSGWSARLDDGSPLSFSDASAPFMRIQVAGGNHRFEFRYTRPGYVTAYLLRTVFNLIVLISGLAVLARWALPVRATRRPAQLTSARDAESDSGS